MKNLLSRRTGTGRNDVVMSFDDMDRLQLKEGGGVLVRSVSGELNDRVRKGFIQPGTVMLYWPEANLLITRGTVGPESDPYRPYFSCHSFR